LHKLGALTQLQQLLPLVGGCTRVEVLWKPFEGEAVDGNMWEKLLLVFQESTQSNSVGKQATNSECSAGKKVKL
jgi:hypothetical protein